MPVTFSPDSAVLIGEYMVTTINAAAPFTPSGGDALSFTAQLLYATTKYEPEDLDTLRVDLCLDEDDEVIDADRVDEEITNRIFLCVQQRVTNKTTDVRKLIGFVGALRDLFVLNDSVVVSGSQRAHLISKQVVIKYMPDELDKNDRFVSVVAFGWSSFLP